jgi:hypothetical protein
MFSCAKAEQILSAHGPLASTIFQGHFNRVIFAPPTTRYASFLPNALLPDEKPITERSGEPSRDPLHYMVKFKDEVYHWTLLLCINYSDAHFTPDLFTPSPTQQINTQDPRS